MLELKHITYQYKLKKRDVKIALDDLSLQFKPGIFYTIFGPSGSGKTTCLSVLGGLDTPTAGEVRIDGNLFKEIGYNNIRKKRVSYVFQDYQLFSYMTAMENILTALKISCPKLGKTAAESKARETLLALGLDEKDVTRRVTKLSGGQKQRVAIARALAVDADYILADEPTGNLDSENTEIIINLLRELVEKYNKCVIVVTHSLVVRDASDISFVIRDGKLADTNIFNQEKIRNMI